MNIYLIIEDGQHLCWQAETMTLALSYSRDEYIDERRRDEGDALDLSAELTYYEENILESCALIGELANPVEQP